MTIIKTVVFLLSKHAFFFETLQVHIRGHTLSILAIFGLLYPPPTSDCRMTSLLNSRTSLILNYKSHLGCGCTYCMTLNVKVNLASNDSTFEFLAQTLGNQMDCTISLLLTCSNLKSREVHKYSCLRQ